MMSSTAVIEGEATHPASPTVINVAVLGHHLAVMKPGRCGLDEEHTTVDSIALDLIALKFDIPPTLRAGATHQQALLLDDPFNQV
jgi:hypothetical protein